MDAEKSSYGAMERFVYIFLLPVLFTVVLTGVLLTLFDYDVKETVYNIGRKIPIINHIVPESEDADTLAGNPANLAIQEEDERAALQDLLAEKEVQIEALRADLAAKEQSLQALESSVENLVLGQETSAASSEEYRQQLGELAEMYSNMTASKAAPILENLTMPELVLVLYEMDSDERGRILERMNPQTAADASIQVKDITEANRAEYEEKAKQAREERTKENDPSAPSKLSHEELAQTFAVMAPESAASILLELNKTNSEKVVQILNAMNNNARSQLLSAINEIAPSDAALLTGKLGQ